MPLCHRTGFLKQVTAPVAVALDNARAYREIAKLKDKLAHEKSDLEGEIRFDLVIRNRTAPEAIAA
jgi:hypothetical protein